MYDDGEVWFGANPDAEGQVYKDKVAEYEAITIQIEDKIKLKVPKEEEKEEDTVAGEVNADGEEAVAGGDADAGEPAVAGEEHK